MPTYGYIRTSRDQDPGHPGSDPHVRKVVRPALARERAGFGIGAPTGTILARRVAIRARTHSQRGSKRRSYCRGERTPVVPYIQRR